MKEEKQKNQLIFKYVKSLTPYSQNINKEELLANINSVTNRQKIKQQQHEQSYYSASEQSNQSIESIKNKTKRVTFLDQSNSKVCQSSANPEQSLNLSVNNLNSKFQSLQTISTNLSQLQSQIFQKFKILRQPIKPKQNREQLVSSKRSMSLNLLTTRSQIMSNSTSKKIQNNFYSSFQSLPKQYRHETTKKLSIKSKEQQSNRSKNHQIVQLKLSRSSQMKSNRQTESIKTHNTSIVCSVKNLKAYSLQLSKRKSDLDVEIFKRKLQNIRNK